MAATWTADLRESLRASGRPLGWCVAALTTLVVIAAAIGYVRHGDTVDLFYDYQGAKLSGSMSVISAFALVSAGFGLCVAAALARRGEKGPWASAGCFVIYLAFDELMMLHETYTTYLDTWQLPKIVDTDRDIYVWFAYFVVVLIVARRLVPLLRELSAPFAPPLVAVILFLTSELLDFVPWESLTILARNIVGPFEEGMKTIGAGVLALTSALILPRVLRRAEDVSEPASPPLGPSVRAP